MRPVWSAGICGVAGLRGGPVWALLWLLPRCGHWLVPGPHDWAAALQADVAMSRLPPAPSVPLAASNHQLSGNAGIACCGLLHSLPPQGAAPCELNQPVLLQDVHHRQSTCRRFIWSRREPPPAQEEPRDDAEESTALVLHSDYAESVEWLNMCWRKVGSVCLQQKYCVAVQSGQADCNVNFVAKQGGQIVCNVLQGSLLRVPDHSTQQGCECKCAGLACVFRRRLKGRAALFLWPCAASRKAGLSLHMLQYHTIFHRALCSSSQGPQSTIHGPAPSAQRLHVTTQVSQPVKRPLPSQSC